MNITWKKKFIAIVHHNLILGVTMMMYQRLILWIAAILFISFFTPSVMAGEKEVYFRPQATLKELAEGNSLTVKQLRKELNISPAITGRTKVSELKLTRDQVAKVVTHMRGDFLLRDMTIAQLLFALIVALAVFLLSRRKMSPQLKFILLVGAILGFGFGLGKSFNPMTGLVKTFKVLLGMEGNQGIRIGAFILFSLLAIVGTKAVCGWACPYGALQEFLHKLPLLSRWKKRNKMPFGVSNTVRVSLFLFFLCDLTLDFTHLKDMGRVVYHYINPFNLFEWHFPLFSVLAYVCITLILSLFFYRPHCLFVCPFGLYSWFIEKISIFRIRINRGKCTDCKACVTACPGFAMKGIYENSRMSPDCFSCGECLDACKFDALSYSRKNTIQ
jgi:polyferredoxin